MRYVLRILLRISLATFAATLFFGACNTKEDDKDNSLELPPTPPTGPSTIRVLVAYTADAWDALATGGEDAPAHAAYRIELTNTVFSNSGISHEVELADAVRLDDVESDIYAHYDCADTDDMIVCGGRWLVDSLQNPASQTSTERDDCTADIVMLVMTSGQAGDAGGSASGIPEDTAPYAQASAAIESHLTLGFVHEVGHLFGAGHDRYERGEENVDGIDYGEVYPSIGARSVMAYAAECFDSGEGPCPQLAWFTNPSAMVYGEEFGDFDTEFNACRVEHFGPSVSTYHAAMYEGEIFWPPGFIKDCPYGALPNVHNVEGMSCSGDYEILDNDDLLRIDHCGVIEGDVLIDQSVTSLSSLTLLTAIEGNLHIRAANLTTLNGLETLQSVATLQIESPITSLVPLSGLETATSVLLTGTENADLSGLEGLTEVESIWMTSLPALASLEGLPEVDALEWLVVSDCDELIDFAGAEHIRQLGTLMITSNQSLERLTHVPWLEQLEELIVLDNPTLGTLAGLENVGALSGRLLLGLNPSLLDLFGLRGLGEAGTVLLDDLDALEDLGGLETLITVHGDLTITDNDRLTALNLDLLSSAEDVVVTGNPNLTDCDLPNLNEYLSFTCDAVP